MLLSYTFCCIPLQKELIYVSNAFILCILVKNKIASSIFFSSAILVSSDKVFLSVAKPLAVT